MRDRARLMGRPEPGHRPLLPSITTVYAPVEDFWKSHWPLGEGSPGQSQVVNPLDALLIHLILDLMPEPPVLVDLSAEATDAAVAMIGATHPRVRKVVAATQAGGRTSVALGGFLRDRESDALRMELVWPGEPADIADDRSPAVVAIDVRSCETIELGNLIHRWLRDYPSALIVLIGLGRFGQCPAMAAIWPPDPGLEFLLVREAGDVLNASTLGLISRSEPPLAQDLLTRLHGLFAGNFGVLELLKTVNFEAIRKADVDADTMKSHVWSWALTQEMDQLRGEIARLKQEAAETAAEAAFEQEKRLRVIWETREALAAAIQTRDEVHHQLAAARAPFLRKVRRRLAAGTTGRIWRAAKRRLKPVVALSPPPQIHAPEVVNPVELSPRLREILPLLACPSCRGTLRADNPGLACRGCGKAYPIHDDRPVFSPDAGFSPRTMPLEHISNQPPQEIVEWMEAQEGWILNIGAGGTLTKFPHAVEVEYAVFRHTDVVSDAHHLPFPDNMFDSVVSFNTFEHLSDPNKAAAEIFRVLKPGGRLLIHTAFLQPLHEPPHHYYNTTEFGLRNWFQAFEIENVSVSANFQPAHVLAWLTTEMLNAVATSEGPEAAAEMAASTLETWREMWTNPARRKKLWERLAKIPQEQQKQWAAGFQLDGRKPTRV